MENRFEKDIQNIKKNFKYIRDKEIRIKVELLLEVMENGNVSIACIKLGLTRKTFYKWKEKLVKANYDVYALKDESRRPHSNPNPPLFELLLRGCSLKTESS